MRRTRLVAYASACLLFVLVPAATSTAGAAPPRAPRGNRVKLRPEPRVSSAISDFAVGKAAASPVTALVAANGTAYLAYTASTSSGFSSAYVCVLPRGATACSHRTLLPPLDNQTSVDDQPDSLLSGPNGTVDVLVTSQNDSNNRDTDTDDARADTLEYVLSPSGAIKTGTHRVGSLDSQGNAIGYDGQILWVSGAASADNGLKIQEAPSDGVFPDISEPITIPLAGTGAAHEFYFYGGDVVALPNGDLLIAWDDGVNAFVVEVDPGDGFKVVGHSRFDKKITTPGADYPTSCLATGTSGTYLLLRSTTGGFSGKLSLYKYTSSGHFSAPRSVPSGASAYGDMQLFEDGDGLLSVYFPTFANVLVQETSRTAGRSWTTFRYPSPTPKVTSNISVALNSFGAGVVFEGAGGADVNRILPRVQPVRAHQQVNLVLGTVKLTAGRSTTATGTATPPDPGQSIVLQQQTSHGWRVVATSVASASGTFSLPIHTSAAGTEEFRAEATAVRGWFYSDYSGIRSLQINPA